MSAWIAWCTVQSSSEACIAKQIEGLLTIAQTVTPALTSLIESNQTTTGPVEFVACVVVVLNSPQPNKLLTRLPRNKNLLQDLRSRGRRGQSIQ